jgi:hypothetical protein
MQKNLFIRIGFVLFLFAVGFLVGAGLSKTVRQLTNKGEKTAILKPFVPENHYYG